MIFSTVTAQLASLADVAHYLQYQPYALPIVILILSLLIGSFLNVVILRYPIMLFRSWLIDSKDLADNLPEHSALKDLESPYTLSKPASHCPRCSSPVKVWQNIPLISYVLLRGQCSGCAEKGENTKISIRYPLVELATGLLSLALLVKFPFSIQLAAMLVFTWSLVAMSVIDIDHQILPDTMTLSLMWLGLFLNIDHTFVDLQSAVIGAIAGYLSLWSVYWLFKLATGKEGMGFGDFKLLAALGAWFGWQFLPMIILLSSLVGAVVGIAGIIILGRDKNIPIPFGPYLAAAGWIAAMWGDEIMEWYLPAV
ncbi:MAG: leader peptidase (prepilin peptidase)/N-methyltransferase [Oleispira sp.]|jgi:leader peptidase (prepilin peptidase)/N-methyltransferase